MTGPLAQLWRLSTRDLRRHPAMGLLLLLTLLVATTTFTLALSVRTAAENPWNHTFTVTNGPHAVATVYESTATTDAALDALSKDDGVAGSAGPFPLLSLPGEIEVMGRDTAASAIDQPYLVAGMWIRDGAVVVEESYAARHGLTAGSRISLAGNDFAVAGVAVSAFRQPTPFYTEGLVWATHADTQKLAPLAQRRGDVLMLRLRDAEGAPAFAAAHNGEGEPYVDDWQSTRFDAITDVLFALFGLIVGSASLAMLAAASVAVLVSGRMAAQRRRAALLKAVGATPAYVGAVMLVEYLGFAVVAAFLGLLMGAWLTPVLAHPVPGILGETGAAPLSLTTIALVTGSAIVLAAVATLIPAVHAARVSTVRTLANPARKPRRSRLMIAVSARLPAYLLFGLRVVARRPGRSVLSAVGLSVTVAAVVVALWMEAGIASDVEEGQGLIYGKLRLVTYTFIAALVVLAAINAILIAWVTAMDNARAAALARAMASTPAQITAGFVAAGMMPALGALVIGIPAGLAVMFTAQAAAGAGNAQSPASTALFGLLPALLLLVAGLTAVPSWVAARRSVVEALNAA